METKYTFTLKEKEAFLKYLLDENPDDVWLLDSIAADLYSLKILLEIEARKGVVVNYHKHNLN